MRTSELSINVFDTKAAPQFDYSELSQSAKVKARLAVINAELRSTERAKRLYRVSIDLHLHSLINGMGCQQLARIRYGISFAEKMLNDKEYCENIIDANLCRFLEDGTYIVFRPKS